MSPLPCTTDGPQAVLPADRSWPLHGTAASRQIEQAALAGAAPHALMARAGLGVARLALAVAPGARRFWVAAGPGNNGGDGLVAARHLHSAGCAVQVSLLGEPERLPADARQALAQAQQAGVAIEQGLNEAVATADLAIDALLGLGSCRAPQGALAEAVRRLNAGRAAVLSVDLPTGLCADTGQRLGDGPLGSAVVAAHSLCLLTLKPGLFTALGRDHAGRVWLDTLGLALPDTAASARLIGQHSLQNLLPARAHAQHKGSFGDLLVLGGAPGMGGAALLAARAALTAGAGRVYLARLDGDDRPDPQRPEIMPRRLAEALAPELLSRSTVVCGCGGGEAMRELLPELLRHAGRLVLDADALNALAADAALREALQGRAARSQPSVLTPHPLEAARLLRINTVQLQAQRVQHAQALAEQLHVTLVLKGSGSVIAAPGQLPLINSSGNARLGSGGSGDVLAGWLGGLWSQGLADQGREIAAATVWLHGRAAEGGDLRLPLRAADLIDAMAATLVALPPLAD